MKALILALLLLIILYSLQRSFKEPESVGIKLQGLNVRVVQVVGKDTLFGYYRGFNELVFYSDKNLGVKFE